MTPDVLADIYQCNITWLDDLRIKAINPKLRCAWLHLVSGMGCARVLRA